MSTTTKARRARERQRARAAGRAELAAAAPSERPPAPGDPLLRWTAAFCLAGAALVHGIEAGPHFDHWPAAGWFFVVLQVVQMLLAIAVASFPSRWIAGAVVAVNVPTVAVWLVSRTVGMPFGPEAGVAEAIGPTDLATAALEIVAVLVVLPLLAGVTAAPARRAPAYYGQLGIAALAVLALTTYAVTVSDEQLPDEALTNQTTVGASVDVGSAAGRRGADRRGPVEVTLSAVSSGLREVGFRPARLRVPAGRPLVVHLRNVDSQPHNLALYSTGDTPNAVFSGDVVQPGDSADYRLGSIAAGRYRYVCSLHPWMTGTVTAR